MNMDSMNVDDYLERSFESCYANPSFPQTLRSLNNGIPVSPEAARYLFTLGWETRKGMEEALAALDRDALPYVVAANDGGEADA